MKSIVEEAATINKAIENAWNRAGNPLEFSIKILEHPLTSFFGLKTSKSAKIALFFTEVASRPIREREAQPPRQARPAVRPTAPPKARELEQRPPQKPYARQLQERASDTRQSSPQERPERTSTRPDQLQRRPLPSRQPEQPRQSEQRQPYSEQRPQYSEQRQPEQRFNDRPQEPREAWNDQMVNDAQEWIKETLVMMGKPEITITPYVSHNYLKLTLSRPVLDDDRQEDTQLKSWGSLAMESVREKARKPLRSLRIVLDSKQ